MTMRISTDFPVYPVASIEALAEQCLDSCAEDEAGAQLAQAMDPFQIAHEPPPGSCVPQAKEPESSTPPPCDWTMLFQAIDRGFFPEVERIMTEAGAEATCAVDQEGWRPFHRAVSQGNLDILKCCIIWEQNPDEPCPSGDTALHLAARQGHTEAIIVLMEYRVNINAYNSSGKTALHLAVIRDDCHMVQILMSLKADTTLTTADGQTLLMLADPEGEVRRFLLEQKIGGKLKAQKAPCVTDDTISIDDLFNDFDRGKGPA